MEVRKKKVSLGVEPRFPETSCETSESDVITPTLQDRFIRKKCLAGFIKKIR